jgi:hypothetical protein
MVLYGQPLKTYDSLIVLTKTRPLGTIVPACEPIQWGIRELVPYFKLISKAMKWVRFDEYIFWWVLWKSWGTYICMVCNDSFYWPI